MIHDYAEPNRIMIFRDLTYDEIEKRIDEKKFVEILGDRYSDFVKICEEVEILKDKVKTISCHFIDDNLKFEITMK